MTDIKCGKYFFDKVGSVEESKQQIEADKPSFWAKMKKFKKPGKQMFWVWIAYQCIKGTITTSLIWIPLFMAWLHHTHG
ncbi:MAG TPA: hypothetical protein PLF01_06060 [Alphaproteobacteria bacterium]|nr:hypothetical protein [Alphaproteobacteria bacterium]